MKFPLNLKGFFSKSQHNAAIFGSTLIAAMIILTPLQRHIALSRPQHYGLAISVLGAGYLLQAALSWSKFSKWERVCYLTTGIFFESVGLVFMQNSWLDSKSTMPTEEQEQMRGSLIACYLTFGFVMCLAWLRLIYENLTANSKKNKVPHDS
jgi:hypothetical protein